MLNPSLVEVEWKGFCVVRSEALSAFKSLKVLELDEILMPRCGCCGRPSGDS